MHKCYCIYCGEKLYDDVCRCFFDDDVAVGEKRNAKYCAYCGLILTPGKKCSCIEPEAKPDAENTDKVKIKMKEPICMEGKRESLLKKSSADKVCEVKSTLKKNFSGIKSSIDPVECENFSYLKKPNDF